MKDLGLRVAPRFSRQIWRECIETGQMGHSPSSVFNHASIQAVEGQFIADYNDPKFGRLGLIVVCKFAPEQEEQRKSASAIFLRHNIPMHTHHY